MKYELNDIEYMEALLCDSVVELVEYKEDCKENWNTYMCEEFTTDIMRLETEMENNIFTIENEIRHMKSN